MSKFAFQLEKAVDQDDEPIEDVYNLSLKEIDDDDTYRAWLLDPSNPIPPELQDEPTSLLFLKSIAGGVITNFFQTVSTSNAFKDHCMDENGEWHDSIDFSPDSVRASFMFGSYGLGLDSPIDRHEWSMFKYHPLVNLLRFIAWNTKGCCPPMHEFTTSDEFFNIFQPQVSTVND